MKEKRNRFSVSGACDTQKGLYDPAFEHDNCGIGAIVNIKGVKTHQVVENALKIVENLEHRAGKGVKCYKITDKSGTVVGFKAVNDDNEIMLITNQGIVIRLLCKDISILGRITTGVKLINMDLESDITVASIAKVRQKSADESESLEMMEREMNEADNEEGNVEEPESPEDK